MPADAVPAESSRAKNAKDARDGFIVFADIHLAKSAGSGKEDGGFF